MLVVAVTASALIFGSLDVIEHALSKPKKGGKRMIVSRGERMQKKRLRTWARRHCRQQRDRRFAKSQRMNCAESDPGRQHKVLQKVRHAAQRTSHLYSIPPQKIQRLAPLLQPHERPFVRQNFEKCHAQRIHVAGGFVRPFPVARGALALVLPYFRRDELASAADSGVALLARIRR